MGRKRRLEITTTRCVIAKKIADIARRQDVFSTDRTSACC